MFFRDAQASVETFRTCFDGLGFNPINTLYSSLAALSGKPVRAGRVFHTSGGARRVLV